MTTLKEAQQDKKKLKQFIKEHSDKQGNSIVFTKLLSSILSSNKVKRKKKSAHQTLNQDTV